METLERLISAVRKRDPDDRPIADDALREAEDALGCPLPESYRRFAKVRGRSFWPVEIFDPGSAIVAWQERGFGKPDYLVPFATDGGGNDWCFDLRLYKEGEYPIEFWDHEEPPDLSEAPLTTGDGFCGWLEEQIDVAIDNERAEGQEALLQRFERLLQGHVPSIAAFTPSDREIEQVELQLPRRLPLAYVAFTRRFGAIDWPMPISDALDIPRLQAALGDELGASTADDLIPFAREIGGRFFCFTSQGHVVALDANGQATVARSFASWVEQASRHRASAEAAILRQRSQEPATIIRRRRRKD